ncbi:COG3772 Phage-related lysozyme (muraminidase) [uncultured Caudovirales phage]|uniref:Endolysin n=1 Tax=uncultured Caudovirales phage TaxID=2100421 RepID=A0A6J5RQ80_9CAUD|nr:COG3772 Phage-related lysozyme (muraminidase) [uncultured Caudovirales phage]
MHTVSPRTFSPACIGLVKLFEGFRANVYECPAGIPTIGYGSTRGSDGQPLTLAAPSVTEDEAVALLARDLGGAARSVLRLISVPLTDGQFDALADFVYNLGGGALQRSTLRAKVNRGEHDGIPAEFMKWVRGGGRVLPGLVKRRAAEVRMYCALQPSSRYSVGLQSPFH